MNPAAVYFALLGGFHWGDRVLDESSFDGSRERWPVELWNATAQLNFCSYFCREHKDGRRRIGWQHSLVGRRPNVDVAKMTAQYLFDTVLRLTAEAGRTRPTCERRSYRDSFRRACGVRLTQRVQALRRESTSPAGPTPSHNLPALLSLYDGESLENRKFLDQQGIKLVECQFLGDRLTHAGGAEAGRLAAESIGLHRQISATPSPRASGAADPGDSNQLELFA